jgi:lysine 2,3-aminomutase
VKTSSVATKTQATPRREECSHESCHGNEAEEEPPGKSSIIVNQEEEPPGKAATSKYRFFGHIPEISWNDWKWHFQNRINTVDRLSQFIPLTLEEQAQIRLVTRRYPLSVTPYYLSLMNPDDPDDPIRR